VHELCHSLGLGTLWDIDVNNSDINRSYIVGAGDNSSNPAFGNTGNIFYTTRRGSRLWNQMGTLLSNTNTLVDITQKFAYNPNTFISDNSAALSAYNAGFNLSLSALPLENGMGSGSFGGHWAEGTADNNNNQTANGLLDNRQWYGVTYPGAPALQDEMMTPIATLNDMPMSLVTLGGLKDLGWNVDFSLAERFEPLVHVVKYDPLDQRFFVINKHNFKTYDNKTGFSSYHIADNNSATYFIFSHLRKGLEYTFIDETGDGLILLEADEITQVTANVTAIANGIKWNVPSNYSDSVVLLCSRVKPTAIIYMRVK
jgi:hypothetical protein